MIFSTQIHTFITNFDQSHVHVIYLELGTCLNMSENVLVGCSLTTQEPACAGAQWFGNGVPTKLNKK